MSIGGAFAGCFLRAHGGVFADGLLSIATRRYDSAGSRQSTCCKSNAIYAQNNAFSGGKDPQSFSMVTQQDIDLAAAPLTQPLREQAQQSLQTQILGSSGYLPALGGGCRRSGVIRTCDRFQSALASKILSDNASGRVNMTSWLIQRAKHRRRIRCRGV